MTTDYNVILETNTAGELDRIKVKANKSHSITEASIRDAIMRLTTCPKHGDIIPIVADNPENEN